MPEEPSGNPQCHSVIFPSSLSKPPQLKHNRHKITDVPLITLIAIISLLPGAHPHLFVVAICRLS